MNTPFKKKKFDSVDNIEWHQGGLDYFDVLKRWIDEAESSVYLQTYIIQPDETGKEIMDALKRANERGVYVQVLIDGFGSANISNKHMKALRNVGIDIRKYSPLFISGRVQLGRRLHQKITVIDRKMTIIGGINISDNYSGRNRNHAWLDYALSVRGKDFGETAAKLCDDKFNRKVTSKINSLDTDWGNYDKSGLYAQIVRNDWLKGKVEITKTYHDAIKNAQKEILITGSYFLPDAFLRRHLTKAAKRGVKITLVFSEHSDVPFMKYATRYLYYWLIKRDIELLEWKPSTIHAKVIVVDDFFMSVGSYNINPLSKFGGIEMNVNVVSEATVQDFLQHWENNVRPECTLIEPEKISKKYSLAYFRQMFSYYYANFLFRFIKAFDQL